MNQGHLIVFCGGDGGGKTLQSYKLADALRKTTTRELVHTREPGGSPGAERIRELVVTGSVDAWTPMTELFLLMAARADHVERTIRPALERGAIVISDRFTDSSVAYQGYGQGLDVDFIKELNRRATGGLVPDLTIVHDIDPEIGLKRSIARLGNAGSNEDRFEKLDIEFHRRLRQGFLDQARAAPERYMVIDATRPPEDIHQEILRAVRRVIMDRAA